MLRLLLLSFCSSAAILLPAAELRIALFTPAQGDAAAFRKLVNSSVIGAPAGQLERLKAALSEAKPQPTPPVTLLTDGLKGKRVESGRSGNLNTLAFADPAKRQLQILVWNTGSTRGFAELVMADAGRFFGSKRVDLRLKLLTTDEKEKQPSTDRGDHAILDGALNFGIPLPPESAALLELAPSGQLEPDETAPAVSAETDRKAAELPPGARNEFADPHFLRHRTTGMNGGVYVQFLGEFCPVSGGGLRIDAGRSLALRVLRVQGSGRFYAYYEARATESVKLVLEVNFMQRQKLLARRKLVAEPGREWQRHMGSYPIPAGTTHVNCTLTGGPAEVRGLGITK